MYVFLQMDTGVDTAGNSEDATASFGDTEGTDQFTGVAIKGNYSSRDFFKIN